MSLKRPRTEEDENSSMLASVSARTSLHVSSRVGVTGLATISSGSGTSKKRKSSVSGTARTKTYPSKAVMSTVTTEGIPRASPSPTTESTLDTLERKTMGESWYNALETEFSKPYFTQLKQFLATESKTYTVYPTENDIYSWSRLTPLDQVKVVIIGQDPYHDVNQAHGLAFSVLHPTKPPPSLRNIYKELADDIPDFVPPTSGDLSALARAGVLLLNSSLTVRAHNAGSHGRRGWEEFTQAVLRAVLDRTTVRFQTEEGETDGTRAAGDRGVVFLAWGGSAQNTCAKAGIDETQHLVLHSAHPSPLSAYRGFFGSRHFSNANAWLRERYGEEGCVNWRVLCVDDDSNA